MPMLDIKAKKPALARAGKIRLGIKKKNAQGIEYPSEVDYFVLKDVPEVEAWATEFLGTDKPKELPIFFPYSEVDECMPGSHKLYKASGLWCRGDGQNILYYVDSLSGKANIRDGVVQIPFKMDSSKFQRGDQVPCPGTSEAERWGRCEYCKPHSVLVFMIRNMPVEDLRMATYHIETRSINNYANLTAQLAWYAEEYGQIAGVPFILKRIQAEIGSPNLDSSGNPKKVARTRTKHWLLELEVDPGWVAQMMAKRIRLAQPDVAPMLAEGKVGDSEDIIEIPPPNEKTEESKTIRFAEFCEAMTQEGVHYENQAQVETALSILGLEYDPTRNPEIQADLIKYAESLAEELPF